jgi:DNA-binding NtrC family response regulator
MNEDQISENNRPDDLTPNSRQRILLVDDDENICRLNAAVLGRCGYEVDSAGDGAAAWEALQLVKYDLLITDNKMPKISGLELIKKIQDARISLPAIMVSGTLPEEAALPNPAPRVEAALLKPYKFEDLLVLVKNVLRKRAEARQEAAPPPNWSSQPEGGVQL